MVYYDIHTHHLPVHLEDIAVLNWIACRDYVVEYPDTSVYYSAGIHPWYIDRLDSDRQKQELKKLLSFSRIVAVGETGLDKLIETPMEEQQLVFTYSAGLAECRGLPLLIHCVKAWEELIRLKKIMKPCVPWIIHGFRGNKQLAKQLVQQGFYLSFGEYFNPEAAGEAWPDHLFVETDESGKDIRTIYINVSTALHLSLESFAGQVANNIHRIFNF